MRALVCVTGHACTPEQTLYLEGNGIDEIEGLEAQTELCTLYVNQNLLRSLDTGCLGCLTNLRTLDISDNSLTSLEGIGKLKLLTTLHAANNRVTGLEGVEELAQCPELCSLDLSNNQLEQPEAVELLKTIPLSLLVLKGNRVVSMVKHYRKSLIAAMPSLNYLDESPVFPKESRLAKAFVKGGIEAEREERQRIKDEEEADRQRHRDAFREMVEKGKAKRQRELMEREELLSKQFHGLEPREAPQSERAPSPCGSDFVVVDKDEASARAGAEKEQQHGEEQRMSANADTGSAAVQNNRAPALDVDAVEQWEQREEPEQRERPEQEAPSPVRQPAPITADMLERQRETQRTFKAQVVRREMARSAAKAEALTSYGGGEGGGEGHGSTAAVPAPPRPAIWGTDMYSSLWKAAVEVGERQEVEAEAEAVVEAEAEGGDSEGGVETAGMPQSVHRKRHAWLPSDDEYSSSSDEDEESQDVVTTEIAGDVGGYAADDAASAGDDLGEDPADHAAAAAAAAAIATEPVDAKEVAFAQDEDDEDGLCDVD